MEVEFVGRRLYQTFHRVDHGRVVQQYLSGTLNSSPWWTLFSFIWVVSRLRWKIPDRSKDFSKGTFQGSIQRHFDKKRENLLIFEESEEMLESQTLNQPSTKNCTDKAWGVAVMPHKEKFWDRRHSFFSVLLLSTLHNQASDDQGKPEIVTYYNQTKAGVDVTNQVIRFYSCKRGTRRWPLCLLYNCLDIAAFNSYILYCLKYPEFLELNKKHARRESILLLQSCQSVCPSVRPFTFWSLYKS